MKRALYDTVRRFTLAATAVLALVPVALCSTWIVDASNGPGTNFTDIPPAIASAAPGDVIIVRQGTYSAFTLTRGMSILGQSLVTTLGKITVSDVPANEIAVLINVQPSTNPYDEIHVTNCAGCVVLQSLFARTIVSGSSDVRLLKVFTIASVEASAPGMNIVDSHVQVVQSTIEGTRGTPALCHDWPGGIGGTGIDCRGASRLHCALSAVRGGAGGQENFGCPSLFPSGPPGYGGSGLVALASSSGPMLELIMIGSNFGSVVGGLAGGSAAGPGGSMYLVTRVNAWTSGVSYVPVPPTVSSSSTLITLAPTEPSLELIGTPSPGSTFTLRLRAAPGAVAQLSIGRTPVVQPSASVLVEKLLLTDYAFPLGVVPGSGVINVPVMVRPSAPAGMLQGFQARVVDPATSEVQRSNSIEAVVR